MSSSSNRWSAAVASLFTAHLALAVALPRTALAQTDDQKDQAKELFADGLELRGKGDDAAALAKFEAAYKLVRSPITTLEYGRSLIRVGRLVEGRERCLEATGLPEKPNESPQSKDARLAAKKLADEVTPRIPTIRVKLEGLPAGAAAAVEIDAHLVASLALATPQGVDPGKHHISAKLASGDERTSDIEVREGDTREVIMTFGSPATAPKGATVDSGRVGALTYVAFGVAGVGVVVGAVTGLIAKSKASDLKSSSWCSDSRCLPPEHDSVDSFNRMTTISTASFVLAGVAAGVGLVTLLTGGSGSNEPRSAHVEPWIGLGSAGVGGAF